LGIRLGATPRGLHQPNMASLARLSKQDISTLLGIGHFYFALTLELHWNNTTGTALELHWCRSHIQSRSRLYRRFERVLLIKSLSGGSGSLLVKRLLDRSLPAAVRMVIKR